jgi:hypothetical protein
MKQPVLHVPPEQNWPVPPQVDPVLLVVQLLVLVLGKQY